MTFFSESTSLYMYSALLQANAAILSIAAIFVIFRIQSLGSIIEMRRSTLSEFTRPPDVRTSVAQIAEFERMTPALRHQWLDTGHGGVFEAYCLPHFRAWAESLDEIARVKVLIVLPTAILAISILLFGVGMACAYRLHTLSFKTEALCLLLALVIEAICLGIVVRAIFALLGIPFHIHFRRFTRSRLVPVLARRNGQWVLRIKTETEESRKHDFDQRTKEAS